ncbi:hypothetical protein L5515_004869 [Caenorhabditis briggsae]|uniref:non-specific serine/threonine protein kinase n=1 Tax=Caenorhabditis briggsae TaxID=6238 RepID=A0AAE9EIT3_CAEBR|nr:hypothetical protein L5515_004869 [Caenorhabditis briggsae]
MSTRLRTKLEPNDIIKRSKTDFNWKVIVQLGVGGFGTVNKVIQINEAGVPINDKEFAMKTELKCAKKQASRLKIERNVMASFAKCAPACKEHFPELIDLGQTLELKAIHDFHILGFLHRDIKPANYCIGAGAKRELIYILDFGLARKYRQKNGQVRAPRNKTKMIGTPRYCPRASHRMEELARKDDFESWYFMLLDFMDGDKGVPWKGQPRETAYALKRKVFDEPKWISTVSRVPAEFGIMAEYLNSLLFNSEVEFGVFREAITDYARGCNLTLKEPLDWMSEMKSLDTTSTSTTMPSTSTLPSTSSTMPSSKIGSSDDNRSIFSEKAEESSIDRSRTGSRSSLNPRGCFRVFLASLLRGATPPSSKRSTTSASGQDRTGQDDDFRTTASAQPPGLAGFEPRIDIYGFHNGTSKLEIASWLRGATAKSNCGDRRRFASFDTFFTDQVSGASCLRGATARLDYKDSFQDVDRGLRRRVRNMEYQNEGASWLPRVTARLDVFKERFPSAPTADPDFDLERILWNDSDEEKSTFTTSNESIDVSDIRTS